jgi:SH3-like domain-containing protein
VKKNNIYLIKIIILFFFLFLVSKSFANESRSFLSLKNDKVNLRKGPSFDHPIEFVYKKKNLTVYVIDSFETFRKIKDFKNNTGWIHVSQLSTKKSAINNKNNSIVYKRPTIYSKPIVKLEKGRLVLIKKCKQVWCKIATGRYKGWILKKYLWGKIE